MLGHPITMIDPAVGLGGQFDGPLERLGGVLAPVGWALVQDAQLQAGLLTVGTHSLSVMGCQSLAIINWLLR